MPRRKDESLLEELFDALSLAPIWVGPVLAGFVLILICYGLPRFLPSSGPGQVDVSPLVASLIPVLGYLLAGAILFVWVAAEVRKLVTRGRLDRQTGADSIRALSWPAFEELVCEAYRRKGYVAEVIGSASGDGGVDVHLSRGGETVLVQCKQWKAYKVGVPTIREMLGVVVANGANKGIVVTSGRFTNAAIRFAGSTPQIELIDGDALRVLIATVQKHPMPTPAPAQAKAHAAPPQPGRQPACPTCGSAMVLRTAKRGAQAGSSFYGCSRYPHCKGILPSDLPVAGASGT